MKKRSLLLITFVIVFYNLKSQTTIVEWNFQDDIKQTSCLDTKTYIADVQLNNATAVADFSDLKNWTANNETKFGLNEFSQLNNSTTDGNFLVSTRGWPIADAFFKLDNLNTSGNDNVSLAFETYTQSTKSYRNWKVEYKIEGGTTWESFEGNTWNLVANDVTTTIPVERVNHIIELPAVLQNSSALFSLRILPVANSLSIDPTKSNNNLAWTKFDNIKLVNNMATSLPSINLDQIILYPSAILSGQKLNIEYPMNSKAIVSFYTITGQLSKSVSCNSNESIDIDDLNPGMYIYRIDVGEVKKTGKILIK